MPTRTPDADPDDPAGPPRDLAGAEAPTSPEIPSLASLRDPRRRTAVDLLVPAAPAAADAPRLTGRPGPAGAPRPAEWPDLFRLGVRLARTAVTVPGRLVAWQTSCLRRVLGR